MIPKLNPVILEKLRKKSELSLATIRSNISRLRRNYPSCTINAVAQLYARKMGISVMQQLSLEDKATLPHNEVVKSKIKIEDNIKKKKEIIIPVINYESEDFFKKGHIKEINRAYSKGCYTSVYVLARKIFENLIREVLQNKFPATSIENHELYFDIPRNRVHDFSVLLKNLYDKKQCFGIDKMKIIERLYQKVINFKDDSNDKVHSWYHLVETEKEIKELNLQTIIELIKKLEEK